MTGLRNLTLDPLPLSPFAIDGRKQLIFYIGINCIKPGASKTNFGNQFGFMSGSLIFTSGKVKTSD